MANSLFSSNDLGDQDSTIIGVDVVKRMRALWTPRIGTHSAVDKENLCYTWATETFPIGGSRTRAGLGLHAFARKLVKGAFREEYFFQFGPHFA